MARSSPARYHVIDTPTGDFAVCEDADGTLGTRWVTGPGDPALAGARPDRALRPDLVDRLDRYFAGETVDFADVAPRPEDAPDFVARCRAACRAIPRGETRSYAELAEAAGGARSAARAAGQAMRTNPLPIIIPCHRVRAANGSLGGFSGSDDPTDRRLGVKRWLLTMEAALGTLDPQLPLPWQIGL